MKVKQCDLKYIGTNFSHYPMDGKPEIAFAGKSNVGKSTLINAILGRKALARTSSQPGKTRTINFYGVNDLMYVVDLPGYGYAKVPKSEVAKWGQMMEEYLTRREELRAIIDRTELNDKLGVCLDTCHVSDAGYDIVNHLEDVLADFDRVIGLNRLKAIHLNDSKNPCGAHKDRHEQIGRGYIGLEALMRVVNHPSLKNLPFELETPNDLAGYAAEIKQIRELAE